MQPQYPYFIGDTYRTAAVIENLYGRNRITQSNFDFSTGEYNRNTYPYLLGETLADNDYVIEPYELGTQTAIVDNLGEGKIDSVNVVSPGDRYIVGEKLNFDLSRGGEGLDVVVSEIFGKEIVEVNTKFRDYSDIVFEKIDNQTVVGTIGTYHDFRNGDTVIISGLSTFVDGLAGKQKVGVVSATGALIEQINAGSAGDVLDIEVSPIPTFVSAGSSIFIGNETFKVLNKIATQNLLRVERDGTGISTTGVAVTFLPNQFTISLTTDDFESSKQDTIFFNPSEQVSLAATAGISSTLTYTQGGITTERDVPAQAIYIPNHPFKTNQSVLLTAPTSADPPLMVRSGYGDTQFLPATVGGATTVFVVNIGKDLIGLKTTRGGDQLYFLENAADTDQYTFVSEFANVTGSVRKVETTVSTAATHGLDNGDKVTFTVKPEGNFGIGNSTDINLSYNTLTESVLVNNIGFNSTGINTSTNRITLVNHGLETGDKVVYDAVEVATGLVAGAYFVYKVDDNNFSLAQSYVDLINNPPRLVDMTGIGATHTIGQINPQIPVTRNKSLVFDTSDSSLTGFKLKFFYDKEFNNPVVSVASSSIFNIQETGVPGTTGVTTVGFSSAWPTKLYYNLEKTGYLSTSDTSVSSYNEINYFDSKYNGSFTVVGVGSTVFTVSLVDEPEETRYLQSDCAVLKYSTTSGTANGGISRTRIVSPGFGFETRPDFVGVGTTSNGINAILETESTTIGQILSTRVANQGFDYPSDKTLTPAALIPSWSQIEENFTINEDGIDVLSGGQGFSGPPILTLVNSLTGEESGGGSYIPVMNENSINGVEVIKQPSGIAGVAHTLYTLNNTNGIVITSVDSVPTGVVTCTIQTPVLGFTTSPILIGDKVFVDGIGNYDGDGFDGHNSKDHKFNFFTVQNVNAAVNPVTVTYSLAGIATQSVGTAVTNTNNLASMVKVQDYPTFDVTVSRVEFALNQSMQVSTGGAFFNTDLVVTKSVGDVLKLKGTYELKVGDKLRGVSDGFICTIVKHESYEGVFKVRHDVQQSFGWSDKIGFTNDDLSVLPDNDYFQNLSYTVKTPLEWKDASGPMNRLLHSSGMKNFVDMEITSPVNAAAPIGIQSHIVTQDIRLDYIAELRADQINAFDLAVDTDVSANVSPAIEFANKKLSSFIKCVTNRVLLLDDISRQFSSEELNDSVSQTLVTYPTNVPTQRILVLSKDTRNPVSYQFNEFILMNTLEGAYILEKGQSTSNGEIVTIDTTIDPVENTIDVNASPVRTDLDYEFKVVRQLYGSAIGVGTLSVGIASVTGVTTSVGAATTTTLFDAAALDLEGFTASVSIIRNSDQYGNYHEVVADRGNGDDVSMAEFGFDTGYSQSGLSTSFIGTFRSYIESGRFKLDYTNNGNETIDAKVRIVGLHKAGAGVGTASFKMTNQSEGSERSARYESSDVTDSYIAGTGYAATVIGVSSETHLAGKSIVRVAIGQSVNVSQLIFSGDYLSNETTLTEYPQLTIADTPDEVGLGTFGTRYNGSNLEVMFYPGVTSGVATITGYHELFYRDQDANADAVNNITYNVGIDQYVEDTFTTGDKLDFELTSDGFPVYAHVFNPNTASVLDPTTGVFTIKNHFLNTGQELVYTPESTIIGVSSVSVGIGSTLVGGGFGTGDAIAGFNTVSGLSTTSGMVVGQLFRGPGLSQESPTTYVVGLGNSVTWFTATSDGTKVLTGVGNTVVLELNETIESDYDYTGFGTITNIGFNSITVSNNVPAGVGSVYHSTRLRPSVTIGPPVQVGVTTFRQQYRSGINTDTMPENVYAIKLTEDTFKLATNEAFANAGVGVTFTSLGSGNAHVLDTTKKLEKSLITLDGINQAPIAGADLSFELRESLGLAQTSFPISGISSVQPGDLMKVGAEIMTINNVGLGTTAGDISGIGTFTVVNVTRGAVGTAVSAKTDGDNVEIYRGSYNIVRNKIHFTEAPAGAGTDETVDEKNLTIQNAKFGGRTFLRQNYAKNALFVDISNQFTGLARTFTLVTDGDANVGFETGSGVLFLNGIFQAPTTANNTENAYETISSPVGVTSAQFNGVRLLDGSPYIDEDDVNQNQIPRGGLIVSLGSTGGKGIAPLVGARFRPILSEGGGISQAVGVGTTLGRPGLGIVTASYTESTGILEVETTTPHKFVGTGENVYMLGLEFTCPKVNVGTPNGFAYNPATGISTISFASAHGLSNGDAISIDPNSITVSCTMGTGNKTYPRAADPAFNKYLTISNATANTFQVNVGAAGTNVTWSPTNAVYDPNVGIMTVTIGTHGLYVGKGVVIPDNAFTFTCAQDSNATTHTYPRATDPASGASLDVVAIGTVTANITTAAYDATAGILTATSTGHGLFTGDRVQITRDSLGFTCTKDGNNDTHTYPREGDPIDGKWVSVGSTTANTFEINVGVSPVGERYTHTFVSAASGALIKQTGTIEVNVGTGGTGTSAHTFVSATSNAIQSLPQSPHTFVSAATNAIKTLNYQGITTTTFPDGTQGHVFEVVGVGSTTIFRADVGISSIPHYYVGSGEVFKFDTEINTGSGYREPVAIAITDPGFVHRFVSAEDDSISVTSFTGSTLTPTNATYEPTTGEFVLTIPNHGLTTSDSIGIKTGSIVFTCDQDNFASNHSYPRSTDPIAGVITPVTSYTSGSITVNVGTNAGFNAVAIATVGAGGTLHVTVSAAGTGYVNPQFIIPDPSYSNLPIEGISRLGEGATTETGFGARITCEVGAGQTNVMSEHHFVTGFKLDNRGYAFRKGDVFRPVGLVTAVGVGATNFEDFELTVLETFTDSFSSWQFGELDYIDSIRDLQNGLRRRFPLRQNSQLLSFQKDPTVTASSQLDLKNILVIFIDGVIQIPGEAYEFDGGTSVVFSDPPSNTSEVDIFFYRGTSGDDSFQASVPETIKKGDSVTLNKKDGDDTTETQGKRLVSDVASSDKINTTIYSAQGVNDEVFRPLDWRKQKADKLINSEIVTKVRDSIEPQIYPVARLIGDIADGDTDVFVDSVRFFQYEEYAAGAPASNNIQVDAFIIDGTENVGAAITAVVGSDTTLTFDVTSGGSGYAGTSVTLGIAAPPRVDNAKYGIVGVGTTAIARGIITNGVITSVTIDNAGGGYNVDAPPQVIVPDNAVKTDTIDNSDIIIGYVGVITGISTTGGGSDPTSIVFETDLTDSIVSTAELDTLIAGYPIYVYDTTVGHGVTAVQGTTGSTSLDDMIVGIGTTFADAVYKVADITRSSNVGVITCHIQSTTNTVGLASTGTRAVPIGRFSWGRLGQVSRSSSPVAFAVSSYTANSGLSTYPIVQRRGYGLRDTGALKKQVAN